MKIKIPKINLKKKRTYSCSDIESAPKEISKETPNFNELSNGVKDAMEYFRTFLGKRKDNKIKLKTLSQSKIFLKPIKEENLKSKSYLLRMNNRSEVSRVDLPDLQKPFRTPDIHSSKNLVNFDPRKSEYKIKKINCFDDIFDIRNKRNYKRKEVIYFKEKPKINVFEELNKLLKKGFKDAKPYKILYAEEFLQAVKRNNLKAVDDGLRVNPDLLLEHDYLKQTAFHWATKLGYDNMLRILLKYGDNFNTYDLQKRTPLYFACLNGRTECVKLLVEHGVDPDCPDINGKYPIDVAYNKEIKKMLTKNPITGDINRKFDEY